MTVTAKKAALENALFNFNFPGKYFIYNANKGVNAKFCLASKDELGGINTHSQFLTYNEFNAYLKGWYDAKKNKF